MFLSAKLILLKEITVLEKIRESVVQLSYCHIYHIMSPDLHPAHAASLILAANTEYY